MQRSSFCLLACLSLLLACSMNYKKQGSFIVSNQSNFKLDSVRITSYGVDVPFGNLNPGERAHEEFSMEDTSATVEGAFLVKVYTKDTVWAQTFGYFPNTSYIKSAYGVAVLDDYRIKEFTP